MEKILCKLLFMNNFEFNLDFKNRLEIFKKNLWLSKKYWILYIIILLIFTLMRFELENYAHPELEIIAFVLLVLCGIFCISYYQGHNDEKELYKTAFIIILVFGIICSFVMPICYAPDEVEHFVRAEMTSAGVLFPEYNHKSFLTIQSTMDLIEAGKVTFKNKYDSMDLINSTIFHTDADTNPINFTLVKYHSAFAQNPFFGYLAPAIGMFFAKLFNLNAIWLLWLGRIFNVLLYASLVSLAIKKTPILKVPLLVISCIPLCIFLVSTVSIDSLIGGLSILTVAYFFYLYKLPKNSIDYKHIAKFSILVLLLGMCKVTCFAFILLLPFIPISNFKENKYYLMGFLSIIILSIIALLWSKYYANPGFFQSFRSREWALYKVNSTKQMNYMLANKKEVIMEILQLPNYFRQDLIFKWEEFNNVYLMFLGAVSFLYPCERFNIKTKIGALLVGASIYIGTYIVFILTWTPFGQLDPIHGVQERYFIPILFLIPFVFGFNHMKGDKSELDKYIIMITILFISFLLMMMVIMIY